MFVLIFGERVGGVWFYGVLDLGAILDGGIFVRLILWTCRVSMLVMFQFLSGLSSQEEVNHLSIVLPVDTHSIEKFSFPIY